MNRADVGHRAGLLRGLLMAPIMALLLALSGCGLISGADEQVGFAAPRDPDDVEFQFLYLARYLDSAKPCYLIHPQSLTRSAFNARGTRVSYVRSGCFRDVAFHTGDAALCRHVRSVSTLFLSGERLNAATCRKNATGNGRVANSLDVPAIVALAGFSDQEVDRFLVAQNRFSSIAEAAEARQRDAARHAYEVRDVLLHSREFFQRIEALPGFADERDRADMAAVPWQPRFADAP
ncbi:hypothetical protein K8B33_13440 [Alcanivorax sp. JB21]|uniref:hypothetical protein n=1 Tax=Alcanivorax limicola TaxID=2874102 RepID=UPI001CBDA0F3|nr:hypothetical protein [Alcanivorax limicola]MBZ2190106.1 hypothetical protein [Alcanivorax limicola]